MSAYELRIYSIAPGRMADIQEAFRALVAPLMAEHDMAGLGYWAAPDGSKLYYVVRHHDLGAIAGDWDRFHADPRWVEGIGMRERGSPFVTGIESVPLAGVDGLAPAREEANLATARAFLADFFNGKHLASADAHLAPGFVQHNAQAPDGVEGLKTFAERMFSENPEVTIETLRTAAEGDLVFLHGRLRMNGEDRGTAVVDVYRFEDGRIAEHWDVLQPIPERTGSGNPMV